MHQALVLDGDAHPNIRSPGQSRRQLGQSLVALSQDLEGVLARLLHHLEHFLYEPLGDTLVEQVTHGVHEDRPWTLPAQRLIEPLRPKAESQAVSERLG